MESIVDYNQEQFFAGKRMPFYMNYPIQNMYLTEMEYEKDMDRMKELYPRSVRHILEQVEEECDKMEYEGSLMFDEYPDRLMIEQIINRIYQNLKGTDKELTAEQYQQKNDDIWNLIGVILNNEMYRRRCRHRRCRRWW
jgi:hypothetical protein